MQWGGEEKKRERARGQWRADGQRERMAEGKADKARDGWGQRWLDNGQRVGVRNGGGDVVERVPQRSARPPPAVSRVGRSMMYK